MVPFRLPVRVSGPGKLGIFSNGFANNFHSNLSRIPTSKWKNRYLTECKNSRKKVPDTTQVGPPLGKRTTRGKHKACWVLFAFRVIVVFETVTVTQ